MTAMAGGVTGGFVRGPGGRWMVVCSGHFPRRALPLFARVGAVVVEGLRVSPDGSQLIGQLPRAPAAGDELVVAYLPEPESRTGIRFNPGSPRSLPVA